MSAAGRPVALVVSGDSHRNTVSCMNRPAAGDVALSGHSGLRSRTGSND
jgi:hypothetical protein